MKKALVLTILGLAAVVNTTYGQGQVNVWNYANIPYNQVYWAPSVAVVGNQAVIDPAVKLTIWYAPGVVTDESLLVNGGLLFSVNPTTLFNPSAGHGLGGYYDAQTQVVPTVGTYTFQIRASGNTAQGVIDQVASRSVLWQPTGIASTSLPANLDPASIGLAVSVPEPTTFALIGLGSAALLVLRRRNK